jgi:hypothetical protein
MFSAHLRETVRRHSTGGTGLYLSASFLPMSAVLFKISGRELLVVVVVFIGFSINFLHLTQHLPLQPHRWSFLQPSSL